ncbi:MAG: hypothetical protein K0R47_1460 [Brevibacillus sp.]|nr:hypothetical protein [Brevibacillus sp.]
MSGASFFCSRIWCHSPKRKNTQCYQHGCLVLALFSSSYSLVQIRKASHDKSETKQIKCVCALLDSLFISFEMGRHAGFPAFRSRLDHHNDADQEKKQRKIQRRLTPFSSAAATSASPFPLEPLRLPDAPLLLTDRLPRKPVV